MKSILDSWLRVQASWMYLQQIFSSADIRRQMPFEGKTFLDVDKFWYVRLNILIKKYVLFLLKIIIYLKYRRAILEKVLEDNSALKAMQQDNLLEKLQSSEVSSSFY